MIKTKVFFTPLTTFLQWKNFNLKSFRFIVNTKCSFSNFTNKKIEEKEQQKKKEVIKEKEEAELEVEEKKKKKINKLHDENKQSEYIWNILNFDRNISFFSTSFYILLAATLALHFYNKYNTKDKSSVIDEVLEKEKQNLLEMEQKRKRG